MIVVLTGNGVIEKSTIYTVLNILKPEEIQLLDNFKLENLSQVNIERNVVALRFDTNLLEDKEVKKLLRLAVKAGQLVFLDLPIVKENQAHNEAVCNEVKLLKSHRIPVLQPFNEVDNMQELGDQVQQYLETKFNIEIKM